MSSIEAWALAILVATSLSLASLALLWRRQDAELELPPPEPPAHRPRHAAWGETTRLRPPD